MCKRGAAARHPLLLCASAELFTCIVLAMTSCLHFHLAAHATVELHVDLHMSACKFVF